MLTENRRYLGFSRNDGDLSMGVPKLTQATRSSHDCGDFCL